MKKTQEISRRQFTALGFAAVLSPIIRVVPTRSIELGGMNAWLSSLIAIVPLVILLLLMLRAQKNLDDGEGLSSVFIRSLGKPLGGLVLVVLALWLVFYAGFIMRSSADRFVSTIYPASLPTAFIPAMAVLALITTLGTVKTLARSAEIIMPILITTLVLVIAFALADVDYNSFSAPTKNDIAPIWEGMFPVVNALGVTAYVAFLEGYVPRGSLKARAFLPSILGAVLICSVLCALVSGTLGVVLSAELNHPFFVLIRNITVFNMLERIEAIVIAIWFFTDFLLIALLLQAVCAIISDVFKLKKRDEGAKGIFIVAWLSVLLALGVGIFLAPTTLELWEVSFIYVPTINLSLVYLLFPFVFLVGFARKRI